MTTEFTAVDLAGQAPVEICDECASLAVIHRPTMTFVAHCTHSSCGGYCPIGREWKVVPKISATDFARAMLRGLVKGELLASTAADIKELLLEAESKTATRH